jgi:hypothetical protein
MAKTAAVLGSNSNFHDGWTSTGSLASADNNYFYLGFFAPTAASTDWSLGMAEVCTGF